MHNQELGKLASGLPHDEYLIETGRVQMAEAIYTLIDNLDQTQRLINEHSSQSRDTERNAKAQRDLTFAGSHYWDIVNAK